MCSRVPAPGGLERGRPQAVCDVDRSHNEAQIAVIVKPGCTQPDQTLKFRDYTHGTSAAVALGPLCEWGAELAAVLGDDATRGQLPRQAQQGYEEIGTPAHAARAGEGISSLCMQ